MKTDWVQKHQEQAIKRIAIANKKGNKGVLLSPDEVHCLAIGILSNVISDFADGEFTNKVPN